MELHEIPLNDSKAFDLLCDGDNIGIFQLETGWIKPILRKIRPRSIEEIAAVLALIRPGSTDNKTHHEYSRRKNTGSWSVNIHPELNDALRPVLRETYGLFVYQEQVLNAIRVVSGWDYAQADDVFKALGKKDREKMARAKPAFISASSPTYSKAAVSALWSVFEPFADYSFNKAHAIGYAHISYWTAYLKANHPREFMTALLTDEDKPEKLAEYLSETVRMGVPLLPPDINESGSGFTSTPEGIRYGLGSIKGLGEPSAKALVAGRPYGSLADFLWRSDDLLSNSRVLKALAESGSFDSVWPGREGLVQDAERLSQMAADYRRARAEGSRTLTRPRLCPESSAPTSTELRQAWETERLGTILTLPEITISIPRFLDEKEMAWLMDRLHARPGAQVVNLDQKGYRTRLPFRCADRGLSDLAAAISGTLTTSV